MKSEESIPQNRTTGSHEHCGTGGFVKTLFLARTVQRKWAEFPLIHRLEIVGRARRLISERAIELARCAGHVGAGGVVEALASEVVPLADAFRFLEKNAERLQGEKRLGWRGRPAWLVGVRGVVRREPLGVVLIVAPGNYPVLLPGVQVAQALTAGNAVVLKPAPGGRSAALQLAGLFEDAGVPAGLIQVTVESDEAGVALTSLGFDKVIFTGSSRIGREVGTALAARGTPSVMELSGCDAMILREDADLELAARALAFGLRLNGSRTCMAPRRVFVPRSRMEQFEALVEQAVRGKSGAEMNGWEGIVVDSLVKEALEAGACLITGHVRPDGRVHGPVVLGGVHPGMGVAQEDLFGAVASLIAVGSDEEALQFCNENRFALGASIFSRDTGMAQRLARRLCAGVVTVNDVIAPTADPRVSFGGRKGSGFGMTRGAEGLLEMTAVKVIQERSGGFYQHLDLPQSSDVSLFKGYLEMMHGRTMARRMRGLVSVVKSALGRSNNAKDQI